MTAPHQSSTSVVAEVDGLPHRVPQQGIVTELKQHPRADLRKYLVVIKS